MASSPLIASATTSMSRSSASSIRKPARTIDWSSAMRTRILTTVRARPEGALRTEAAAIHRARAHLAAIEVDSFWCTRSARARVRRLLLPDRRRTRRSGFRRGVVHGDFGVAGRGVLDRVGEAFLDDPIGGEGRSLEATGRAHRRSGSGLAGRCARSSSQARRARRGPAGASARRRRYRGASRRAGRRISASAARPVCSTPIRTSRSCPRVSLVCAACAELLVRSR